MLKVAIIFERFGPYHIARMEACSKVFHAVGIELCALDSTYEWTPLDGEFSFEKVTLFKNENVSPKLLRGRLEGVLNQINPDVVAIPGWSLRGSLVSMDWCLRREIPFVLMSDSQFEDKVRRCHYEWIKGRIVGYAGAALVAGARHVNYLRKLGAEEDKIFVGYDVVDNEHFAKIQPLNFSSDDNRGSFLTVSRFVSQKNLRFLLQTYNDYLSVSGDRPFDLILVGDGPERPELESLISKYGLKTKVHMAGFRQYEELPGIYQKGSVFILPSTVEPWGLVVNEAMASGLPVLVSSKCGCVPELVQEGVNGYIFDPGNSEELLQLMTQMSGPSVNLAEMGKASQNIVHQWSPAKFAAGIFAASNHALTKQPKRYGMLDRFIIKRLSCR